MTLADLAAEVASTDAELAYTAAADVADPAVRDATRASIAPQIASRDPHLARAAVDHPRQALVAVRELSRTVSVADATLPDVTYATVAEQMASGPYPRFASPPSAASGTMT